MNDSLFLFGSAMLVGVAFLAATVWTELEIPWTGLRKVGVTSLGRNSVNWLAAIALLAAIAICTLVN